VPDPFLPPIDPSYSLPPQQFDDRDDELVPELLPLPPQGGRFDVLPLPVSLQTQFESPIETVNMPFVDQQAIEQLEYLDKISVHWNYRLLIIGPLLLFFLVAAGVFSRRHFRKNWQAEWRQAAIAAAEAGDDLAAISQASFVLKLDPDDPEMRLLLAQALLRRATTAEEFDEGARLMQAHLGEQPGDRKNRLELIRSGFRVGRYRWILNEALAPVRDDVATDAELREFAIQCHSRLGENVEAARVLLQLIESEPGVADHYRRALSLIDTSNEPVTAFNGLIKDLDSWRARFPENREIPEVESLETLTAAEQGRRRVLESQSITVLQRMGAEVDPFWGFSLGMAQHYLHFGNLTMALAQWQDARQIAPTDSRVIAIGLEVLEKTWQQQIGNGDVWRARKSLDEAVQLLQPGLQQDIADLGLYEVLARLQFHREEHRAAVESCRQGLKALSVRSSGLDARERVVREVLLRMALAESLVFVIADATEVEHGELDVEMRANLEALTRLQPQPQVLQFVEALAVFADGHPGFAVSTLENLRISNASKAPTELQMRIDWWLCECHRLLARQEPLQRVLERAVADHPDWGQARYDLARFSLDEGRGVKPFVPAELDVSREPTPFDVEQLMAAQMRLPRAQRVWTTVDSRLKSLLSRQPDDPAVLLLQAERWLAVAEWSQAADLLEGARKKSPGELSLAQALVRLTRMRPDLEQGGADSTAQRIVDEFQVARGDRPETRQLKGLALGLGDPQKQLSAEEFENLWKETDDWSLGQRRDLAVRLLRLALRSRHDDLVTTAGRRGLQAGIRDVRLLAGLAAAAIRTSQDLLVQQTLQAIGRLEGEAGPWGNLLESYSVLWSWESAPTTAGNGRDSRQKPLWETLKKLERSTGQRPAWAQLHRLRAVAHQRWGDPDEALAAFQLASRLGDDSPETRVCLIDNLFRQRRDQEMLEWHDTWDDRTNFTLLEPTRPGDEIVALPLASEETLTHQRQLMEAQLAMGRDDDPADLLKRLETLTREAPALWRVWPLRLQALRQSEGREAALAQLPKMLAEVPQNPPQLAPLVAALCWELLEEPANAETSFRQATQLEAEGWEALREYLLWCVRQGRADEIPVILDLRPALAQDPLADGFRDWVNEIQMAAGAAVATSLADYEKQLTPLTESLAGLIPVESRHEVWFDCLARSRVPRHRQQGIDWLEHRGRLSGLTASRTHARYRLLMQTRDLRIWDQLKEDLQHSQLDLENASVVLGGAISSLEVQDDPALLSLLDQAFEVLRRREPRSLRTAATEATIFTLRQFPLDAAAAFDVFRKRLSRRTPAEMLVDLARAGRLQRLKTRLAEVQPADRLNPGPWSELDLFPSDREVILSQGDCPKLAPLWEEQPALECLQNEVTLLVGLGLESIIDVEGSRDVMEGFGKRSRIPQDRFELPLFLARQGEFSEAQQLVNQITPGPKLPEVDLALCLAHVFESATNAIENWNVPYRRLNTLRKDLLTETQSREVRVRTALFRGLNGKEDEAIDEYRQLVNKEPDNLMLRNNLAWFLGFSGQNLPEARQMADDLVRTYGELPELLDTRGSISLLAGDLDQARRDFELAVTQGGRAIYSAHLALCLSRQKEEVLAEKMALRALRMGFRGHHWARQEEEAWGAEFEKISANLMVTIQERLKGNRRDTDGQTPP